MRVRLVPLADAEPRFTEAARAAIVGEYGADVDPLKSRLDLAAAHHAERNQYHSTVILEQLARLDAGDALLLAIAPFDLYIPILTFVFGEAQLGGRCAVVSYYRMAQERYGLPPDDRLAAARFAKSAVHEVGHLLGLTHCDVYECAMAASHSVEWLDMKRAALCDDCRLRRNATAPLQSATAFHR